MSRMLTKLAKEVCSFFFVGCSIDGFGLFLVQETWYLFVAASKNIEFVFYGI